MIRLLHFVLFLITTLHLYGQCPTGKVIIESQKGLDQLRLNYPNCDRLIEPLVINSNISKITSLKGLQNFKHISNITIEDNPELISLSGLENLEIASSLIVRNCPSLVNISALDSMTRVSSLIIENCSSINWEGSFESLSRAFDINVINDDLMTRVNVEGFEKLIDLIKLELVGNVYVKSFPAIEDLLVFNLIDHPQLLSFSEDDFFNLVKADQVVISKGKQFSFLGIERLTRTNKLGIEHIEELDLISIENHPLPLNLVIKNCQKVKNLELLSNVDLTSMSLIDLPSIEKLPKLNNTDTLEYLNLRDNEYLKDIRGLEEIEYISLSLKIYSNRILSECSIKPICDRLSKNVKNDIVIGNLASCSTIDSVLFHCNVVSSTDMNNDNALDVQIFPNPVRDQLTLAFNTSVKGVGYIFDTNGRIEDKFLVDGQVISLDVTGLNNGMYAIGIYLKNGNRHLMKSFIVED